MSDAEPALHTPVDTVMRQWPVVIRVFIRHRMLCVGCHMGAFCTVAAACADYDLDSDAFLAELNASIGNGAEPNGSGTS